MRLSSYLKGYLAELYIICFYLLRYGAIPLKWRYKTKLGEVDLILRKANLIIFVEVKYRKAGNFLDIVSKQSLFRIRNAAQIYLKYQRKYQKYRLRLDVCYVDKSLKISQKKNIIS